MWSRSRTTATHIVQVMAVVGVGLSACKNDGVVRPLSPTQLSLSKSERNADVQAIATWNIIALKTTAAGPFSPPRESRSLAIVFASVNDAVCSITRQCPTYAGRIVASHDASIEAAVSAAAHDALAALYPAPATITPVNASYDSALAALPAGSARDAGVAVGQAAAAAMLALRANDGSQAPMSYTPTPGLGSWVPTPPAFAPALEPQWGAVTPFLLDAGSQFRPPPPPTPGSDAYVRDYVEIYSIGAANSTTRTASQSETANFWVSTGPQLWNQVVRQVTTGAGINASKAARISMLVNLAGADAIVAAWDAKYTYSQWRPVTAIRGSFDDGSAATVTDPNWLSFITTPRFPDYIAGHATYAGAAEQVLTGLFGEDPGSLSITSPTAGNVTHTYSNFHAIAEEVSNARVWGGIHWRTSVVVGRLTGQKVGAFALASRFGRVDSDDADEQRRAHDASGRR